MYPYFLSLLHFTPYPSVHHHLFNAAIVAAGVRITFCNTFLLPFIYSIYYNSIQPNPQFSSSTPLSILFYFIPLKVKKILFVLFFPFILLLTHQTHSRLLLLFLLVSLILSLPSMYWCVYFKLNLFFYV